MTQYIESVVRSDVVNSERDRAVDLAYRDYAPDVYRVAYAILRDADEAIDATHEAFARAWERWEQYDDRRPLQAWLHGIVVHEALDQLRRRRVRRVAAKALGSLSGDHHPATAADMARDVVSRGDVEQALGRLKPETRAVLVLRHYYGYEYAEIAAFLGTKPGSVGSTLSRAHAQLRDVLGGKTEPGTHPSDRPATTPAQRTPPEALR
jgi:RNA polymerase sigma-70 factor (ECF subfamily)